MLVCRFWYDTLDRRSLLHTVTTTTSQFVKLKEILERFSYRGSQVEYLTMDLTPSLSFDKRIICNLFPNLREIHFKESKFRFTRTTHLSSPFQFTLPSLLKLEKLSDCAECELARELAMSDLCSNLKSLYLSFPDPLSGDILSQLKNMPVLEILTLGGFQLKLMDLEMVHCNIPSIKSLCLINAIIDSGEFPNDIIPATLITTLDLSLSAVDDLHTHIELYKYLAKKYSSVSKPTFEDNALLDVDVDVGYARDVYNKGIIPCYQKIGSKIDTFSFDSYCDGLDAFRKFDLYGIKLTQLKLEALTRNKPLFIEELVQSQQSKYIQKLILINIIPAPLEMMINMEMLTSLKIDFQSMYNPINFSQLIDACSAALTDLTIENADLTFNKSTSNITSIQNMNLTNIDIHSPTTITGKSFPKLSVFYLSGVISCHLTISLPDHHLKKVNIEIECPQGENCVLSVNTMKSGKPQRSLIRPDDKHDYKGQPSCGDTPTSSPTERIIMDFTCASVKELSNSISEIEEEEEEDEEEVDEDEEEYDAYAEYYRDEYYGTRDYHGSDSDSDSYEDEYY
jgi:hypothetical protein